MTAQGAAARLSMAALKGVNVLIFGTSLVAIAVIALGIFWFGDLTLIALLAIGALFAIAHLMCLVRLPNAKMAASKKLALFGLVPLPSLVFSALIFLGPL